MVVAPIQQAKIVESTSLDATGREAGGFGSTGMATANRPAKQTE
jgi:dUTPase